MRNIQIHKDRIIIYSFFIIAMLVQIKLLTMEKHALVIIVLLNVGLFLFVIFYLSVKNLFISFLVINLVPLLYFNLPFHYSLRGIIVQDVPLVLMFFLFLFASMAHLKDIKIRFNYLELPIAVFGVFIFFMAAVGLINNGNTMQVVDEVWHSLYYLAIFVIGYFISKRKQYKILINFLLILFTLVSIELLFYSTYYNVDRFVIFQSYVLPLFLSISVSLFVFFKTKFKVRLFYSIVSIFFVLGIFITLTRTVWVASLISLFVLLILYFKMHKNISVKKIILVTFFMMIPVIIFVGNQLQGKQQSTPSQEGYNDVEYRTQSVANPTEDFSFLMRVELTVYIVEKILEQPIIGHGFADYVEYKILGITDVPIYYPDNSWLFFFWKGGIIGFSIFLWIYLRMLKSAILIARKTDDLFVKSVMFGIFAGLIGLIFLGLFNAVLIKYKTTLILPILFSYINYEYNKITNTTTDKSLHE